MAVSLDNLSDEELLQLWAQVMRELRERNVIRSSNNPIGDYCERLVATHFGVEPAWPDPLSSVRPV